MPVCHSRRHATPGFLIALVQEDDLTSALLEEGLLEVQLVRPKTGAATSWSWWFAEYIGPIGDETLPIFLEGLFHSHYNYRDPVINQPVYWNVTRVLITDHMEFMRHWSGCAPLNLSKYSGQIDQKVYEHPEIKT